MTALIRPFLPADLMHYRDKAVEVAARAHFDAPVVDRLHGWTMECDDTPLGSAGMSSAASGLAYCWAVLTPMPHALVMKAHRRVRQELLSAPWPRIEAHVAWEFSSSHRWVRLLGFVPDPERPTMLGPDRLYMRYVFKA